MAVLLWAASIASAAAQGFRVVDIEVQGARRVSPDIIRQAVWLYFRFTLSLRDVEDLMAERGIDVTYETIRCWVDKFGPAIAANIRKRRAWFETALQEVHGRLATGQRMLVEYKPFEPAFYHTDIADWGMALLMARAAGPQAKVLVDTGHHYQAQNIEQIVAWLLSDNMLGGFHFNDRRYADDDLTIGSIDP